jgi:CBS domain-containing protein
MQVKDYLSKHGHRVVTCLPEHSLAIAANLLHRNRIGALPVCDTGGRLVGIISERDLVRTFATRLGELERLHVRDVMSHDVVTCSPDVSMQSAARIMAGHGFRHLPVVENGQVIANISIRDTLANRLQEQEAEVNVLRDVVVAARHR